MIHLDTPVIEIQLPDQEASAAASSQRTAEVAAEVERAESVIAALQAFGLAEGRVSRLRAAQTGLNARGKELIEAVLAGHCQVEESLLAQYSGAESTDTSAVIEALLRTTTESTALSKTLRRVVEHLLPVAQIEMTRAEANVLFARSDELTRVADARFVTTSEKLRAAAEFEAGLRIDIRSTFSGALLGCAQELRRQAQARDADWAQKRYEELNAAVLAAQGNV